MVLWNAQVPTFNTCCIAEFLLNSNEIEIFLTLCALTLTNQQSFSEAGPYVWLMTNQVHNVIVFQEAHFSLLVVETKKNWRPQDGTASCMTGTS